ncbi:OmpW/AlkL family protein [Chachezhania sediminis]|uniref:OmpW/AlkL family protein n=1 Tax=Chachezhania sediminis TaxID=2599291 RepID=UPI00131BDA99|nr:OmpW family outer membrane protein [Chachezhania sediminis]
MTTKIVALTLATALTAVAAPAFAQNQGDWTVGIGLGYVNPKSTNATVGGSKLEVGDNTRPTLTVEYFIRDNLGIELLAAAPFEHDISLGGNNIGSTKQLPPTVSLNYHFPTQTIFKPFVGVGVNYTTFWDTQSSLGDLSLDNSWGYALHAGADFQFTDNDAIRFDVRYIDISTKATLNGTYLTDVDVDPVVLGVSYVHRF